MKWRILLLAVLLAVGGSVPCDRVKAQPPVARRQATGSTAAVGHVPGTKQQPVAAHSRVVYLTFDDGPNTTFTPQILDILRRHGVKATFMVTGRNAQLNQAILRRIHEEGHAVGNHSYNHDYAVYRSPTDFVADLERAQTAIEAVTGVRPRVYRPPGGPSHLTPALREILHLRGYRVVAWNVTSADTDPHGVTPEQLVRNVVEGVRNLKGDTPAVVLMHDGTQTGPVRPAPGSPGYIYLKNREATVAALPVILRHLQEQGCVFLTLEKE